MKRKGQGSLLASKRTFILGFTPDYIYNLIAIYRTFSSPGRKSPNHRTHNRKEKVAKVSDIVSKPKKTFKEYLAEEGYKKDQYGKCFITNSL